MRRLAAYAGRRDEMMKQNGQQREKKTAPGINKHRIAGGVFAVCRGGIAAGLILLGAGSQWSAMSTVLPATARPDLPVCTVTAGPATVDFGSRTRGQLQDTAGGLTPGVRRLTVSAGCTLSRVMKLRFDGSARGADFSWGGADSILRFRVSQAQLDGIPVQLQRQDRAGNPEAQGAEALPFIPGDILMAVKNGLPVHGRQLNITLEIEPVMGERDSRPVRRTYPEGLLRVSLVP